MAGIKKADFVEELTSRVIELHKFILALPENLSESQRQVISNAESVLTDFQDVHVKKIHEALNGR